MCWRCADSPKAKVRRKGRKTKAVDRSGDGALSARGGGDGVSPRSGRADEPKKRRSKKERLCTNCGDRLLYAPVRRRARACGGMSVHLREDRCAHTRPHVAARARVWGDVCEAALDACRACVGHALQPGETVGRVSVRGAYSYRDVRTFAACAPRQRHTAPPPPILHVLAS